MKIIGLIIVVLVVWFWAKGSTEDPKKQIAKLWKEIHRRSAEIGKFKDDSYIHGVMTSAQAPYIRKAGDLIDALLAYHFTDMEDEKEREYVIENTYLDRPKGGM